MLVGLDFDNTVVCYDALFHRLATERGLLPPQVPATKGQVRDYLRRAGREDLWTELQGIAYGPRMAEATPFPGVLEFLARCRDNDDRCVIVSHKTRYPYAGTDHDLHVAAREWLVTNGFLDRARTGLSADHVYLELTKEAKLERIAELRCDVFVDDLPEFLAEPSFPPQTDRIWFAPANGEPATDLPFRRAESWRAIGDLIFVCDQAVT